MFEFNNTIAELPRYSKQASMEKESLVFSLSAAGVVTFKALMAYFAAKGAYDIGTKNIPGMVRDASRGDWKGVGGHTLRAGGNALMVAPTTGVAGKALKALKGTKMLGSAGKGGVMLNRGGRLARSALGRKLEPVLRSVDKVHNKLPGWVARPDEGWKNGLRSGAGVFGAFTGAEMLDPSYEGIPPRAVAYPASNAARAVAYPASNAARAVAYPASNAARGAASSPGFFANMKNYLRNLPRTPPQQFRVR